MKSVKVALVHDYFLDYGGAERVVETLHGMFPDAPIFTAFVNKKALGIHWEKFHDWDIRESWAVKIPLIKTLYSPLRVLSAKFFSSFDLSGYDLVISSTNMYMAKAVRTQKPTAHICYCHTPPRSLYGYTTMTDWKKNIVIRVLGNLINHYMRIIDFQTAQNPDQFIANSKEVQRRIAKFYRRDSVVIYPPIVVPTVVPKVKKEDFCLFVGRLALSKHVDLVIRACKKLGKKLLVVGTGKNLAFLRSIAGETVTFLGSVPDEKLNELYEKAQMVVYPAEDEDFGMIAVEAMAHGTPAVVHRSGGFLESVVEGKTGVFIDELTVSNVIRAITEAEKRHWDPKVIHAQATKFSEHQFVRQMQDVIKKTLESAPQRTSANPPTLQ